MIVNLHPYGEVEASDYLSHKHDWVQTKEESTHPMRRIVFYPNPAGAGVGGEL